MRWTEEELGRFKSRSGVAVQPRTAQPTARPRPMLATYAHRRMNKTEALYALELETRRMAGLIRRFRFEAFKLRLADRTFYTPDFTVWGVGGEVAFHEVKGFWEEDARVKFKVAASEYPEHQFVAVTHRRKRDGGGWAEEAV